MPNHIYPVEIFTDKLTRLIVLCLLHNQQGGTIHQFNEKYETDFINMNETVWDAFVHESIYHRFDTEE